MIVVSSIERIIRMTVNWTIIGTGVIANEMATAFNQNNRNIYGVFSRNTDKTRQFANKYGINHEFSELSDVFSDDLVDAVYIATPHNTHFDIAKQAIAHGKHVLMEKAITLNKADLDTLEQLAQQHHVVLLEAMTLVHMPLIKKIKSLITENLLGDIKHINVTLGSVKPYDPKNRFFNPDLGGGVLLDMGVYALSGVRYFMSEQPNNIQSFVDYAPTGVDEQSVTILHNQSGEMATVSVSLQAKQPKALTISGTKGYIQIPEYPRAQEASWYHVDTEKTERISEGNTDDALFYEIADFESIINNSDNLQQYKGITDDVFSIFEEMKKSWSEQKANS